MGDPIVERIRQHPQYPRLKTERSRLGWTLTILMLIVFYGFIGLIAFDRQFLAQPLSADGVTTIGIPIALGGDVENVVLARAVKWHAEHRIMLNGHKTVVFR